MARRGGRKGEYLMSDDYTGFTEYSSKLKRDYWGNWAVKPLERNLQEIAKPLLDPQPVPNYNGPTYEVIPNPCIFETQPAYIGLTTRPTLNTSPATQALNLNPAIPNMEVGCTFVVR